MADVESFTLDHTAVRAPYVRLIGVDHGPKGDAISNFDVRFVQPNEGEIPTAGLHTITWGEPDVAQIVDAVRSSLTAIAEEITWDEVPAVSAVECGNYRDHSLHSAREWSKRILEQGISLDAFDRVGV
jgi:S-ribosylhomocysteine lyase